MSSGALRPGKTLPGEQRLAEQFGVSRVTVRRALDALDADGLIDRRAGSGTTVRSREDAPIGVAVDFATLLPQLVDMGQRTSARLMSFSYCEPPQPVAEAMKLGPDVRVQAAVRIRLMDKQPFSHLTTYVPEKIAANYTEADLATTPLFRLLERSGVQVSDAHQSVTATLASPDVAEALGFRSARPCCLCGVWCATPKGAGLNISQRCTGPICSVWKCRWRVSVKGPPPLGAGDRRNARGRGMS